MLPAPTPPAADPLADAIQVIVQHFLPKPNAAETVAPDWPLHDAAAPWSFPPVEFAVESLLPMRGTVWIGGLPKQGKSLLALYLGLAIACRRQVVAGHFRVLHHPRILYLAREDSGLRLQERRDDILGAWGVQPQAGAIRFVIRPRFDLLNPQHVRWLRETCRREGITLVVLDTWTALSPGADPMAAKDQAQLSASVVGLAQDIDGGVVVIDHTRKNRPEGHVLSSADIFGPQQKWAAAEHIVMLGATGNPSRIEVFVEGKDSDSGRFFLDVSQRGSAGEKFRYAGSVQTIAQQGQSEGSQNRELVRQVVIESASALTKAGVVAALEARGHPMAERTVSRHLEALAEAGELVPSPKKPGSATKYTSPGQVAA